MILPRQGEIKVDQAHRGYDVVVDDTGKARYSVIVMIYDPAVLLTRTSLISVARDRKR